MMAMRKNSFARNLIFRALQVGLTGKEDGAETLRIKITSEVKEEIVGN